MTTLRYDLVETALHGTGASRQVAHAADVIMNGCHCTCHYPFHQAERMILWRRLLSFILRRPAPRAWMHTPRWTPQRHVIACCSEDPTGAPLAVRQPGK